MSKPSIHELPLDRLATTDEVGRRVYLYPADVKGRYRTWRDQVSLVLLAVFLLVPWIKIQGHPALLLDIPNRRFAILGLTFWAHETPLLFLVVSGAILSLFLVTAIWGRVWCGWACPQTVFVDAIFRRIERWTEGDSLARRRLDQQSWSGEKVFKKSVKWAAFATVSLAISHSFLAYFVGPEELGRMIQSSPAQSPTAFAVMSVMFGAVLFDFGWFREQFCTVVCPYGRFQSVLMDEQSRAVFYDTSRGEPRRGCTVPGKPAGDCVNCYRCVQVCPTGIDIRRGLQMECIGCTACIDACDEVMSRLEKPRGLIRYSKAKGLSPRTWIYGILLLGVASGLTAAIHTRKVVELNIIRAAETPYQELEGGRIVNHFKLDLANQSFEDTVVEFEIKDQRLKVVISNHANQLGAGQSERADLFIEAPKALFSEGRAITELHITAHRAGTKTLLQSTFKEVRLVGPYQ
jgi:cytochrome c oxidase accessory protein FixG